MPFDIQVALNALPGGVGEVIVPDGTYTGPFSMPTGSSLRGQSLSGTVLVANAPNADIITATHSGYSLGHNLITNMTLRSTYANVGGIHFVYNGGCTVRDVLFQGLTRNVHIDRGLGYSLQGLKSETYGANLGGSILIEASDGTSYTQYVAIDDYQSYFATVSSPLIISRGTNVVVNNLLMHAPKNVGIMINNDSQGIQISNTSIVDCTDGVQIYAQNGHTPLGIEFNSLNVDQATGLGLWVGNGTNIHVRGGLLTSCNQGIEISNYASCNTIFIDQTHIFAMANNGIVIDGNASYFYITNCIIGGNTHGAAIVISSGVSDHYIVVNNDVSQNNQSGFVNFSSGGTHRIVSPNIV